MLKSLLKAFVGSHHKREAKKLEPLVQEINENVAELASLTDEQLKAKTEEFRRRIQERTADLKGRIAALRDEKRRSEDPGERERLSLEINGLQTELKQLLESVLEELLPEAFAVVKDACRRLIGRAMVVTGQPMTWDMVPYDVQLIGAIALHRGKVAEMATGEGKTLVATMPLYLNALTGRGVHLVTVNSYLAQRDAEWMGTVFGFLGLTVDCIDLHEPGTAERRAAYHADITYGTNNEFGFDYLRDNMVHALEFRVQRPHNFAIIDEVDSILIDEARTPLIISGPVGEEQADEYRRYNPAVSNLYRKQTRIVNELVSQAEKHLEEGNEEEAGQKLLAAKRGAPKHKRLLKLMADNPAVQRMISKVEAELMRDKRLHELDEHMLYAMDEKGHSIHLSELGLDELSPQDPHAFVVPDISQELGRIEHYSEMPIEED